MNCLVPQKTAKYLQPIAGFIDFLHCRVIVTEDSQKTSITLTTVQDLAAVVAKAIEYEGEWPPVSGIRGNQVTIAQLIQCGENLRGNHDPFYILRVALRTHTYL